ncbi:TPA: Dynein assembly factor 3, axonemal [Trebouxia sp. C0006]
MAKVFDEDNVHNFWGLSPSVDVLALLHSLPVSVSQHSMLERLAEADAIHLLQIGAYDCRHSAQALASMCKLTTLPNRTLHIWVYEEAPEILARHMLLLSVLLDNTLPVRQRTELFIELHGNACIQATTAQYLGKQGHMLESVTLNSCAGTEAAPASVITELFDLSLMRFQQRDDVAETFRKYSHKAPYDMQTAWDARIRKFYGSRYDYKRNAIDWDYHMRLAQQGTPGLDPSAGSIIHFYHFRRWRECGVAYELRDCKYSQANPTLLSTAFGTCKEYKDRLGNDKGRSVSAWGFWGDILNSPYHSFGTSCSEPSFLKISNKQFVHTAVSVAEYNVTAIIEEMRRGKAYELPKEGMARSKLAAGPTTLEDLEEMADNPDGQSATKPDEASSSSQSDSGQSATERQQAEASTSQASAQEQAQSDALDAAMTDRCKHVKIHFLTGDIKKLLLSRSKYAGMFSAITVGHRHVHLVDKEHELQKVAAPGAVLAVETAKYMLQLTSKQVELFSEAVAGKAMNAGWQSLTKDELPEPDANQLFAMPG